MTDEVVMYIIARQDLGMSPGKLAAQVGHGVQLAMRKAEDGAWPACLATWESGSYAKVVLGIPDLGELHNLANAADDMGYPHVLVNDEGRTEIAPTTTCVALVPMPRSMAKKLVGELRLYK